MKPKWIALSVAALLFMIILFQNTQVVTLHLFFWKVAMSQIILIPLSILLGFALGFAVAKLIGRHGFGGKIL